MKQQWLPFFTSSDDHTVISHHFQSAAIFRTEKSSWSSWVHRGVCVLLAPLEVHLEVPFVWGCCWGCLCAEQSLRSCLQQQCLADGCCTIPCSFVLIMNQRGREEIKMMFWEMCVNSAGCASPVLQWSSFLVVLFLFLQGCFSAIHFKYLPLWNFLFLKTLMAFILVEDGISSMQATHEWKTCCFFFFSKMIVCC